MKKGTILFVTEGRDLMQDDSVNLKQALDLLGVQAVSLATSEDDVAYAWWKMVAKGMHHVSLLRAVYHAGDRHVEFHGPALRLWG
jgi:hypothetical protein